MEKSASVFRCFASNRWRLAVLTLAALAFAASAQSQQGPRIWLQDAKRLTTTFNASEKGTVTGSANPAAANLAPGNAAVQLLRTGQAQPLSMVNGDFDRDGVEDLVVGYRTSAGGALAVYRGNLDAFAPQSDASFRAIGRGEFPSPFLGDARVVELPEAPDFLVAGNFNGDGHLDIAVGARGSHTLYILGGDGKGGLLSPQGITLSGALTVLGTVKFEMSTPFSHIVAGTSTQSGSQLTVFEGTYQGLAAIASIALRAPATSLAFGNLSGNPFPDVAVVAGGELLIVHGSDVHLARAGADARSFSRKLGGTGFRERKPASSAPFDAGNGLISSNRRGNSDARKYRWAARRGGAQARSNRARGNDALAGPHFFPKPL